MNNRVTRGASFNRANPEDRELLAWLDSHASPSEALKNAVRIAMGQLPVWTRPAADETTGLEVDQLRGLIRSLTQRIEYLESRPAGQAVSTETPGEIPAAAAPGPALRPEFIESVRKAARPGIRLEDK